MSGLRTRCLRLAAACSVVAVVVFAPRADAAPPYDIASCSDPEYRQDHLAYCNLPPDMRDRRGGGGPPRSGGLIGDLIGGIGGLVGGLTGGIL